MKKKTARLTLLQEATERTSQGEIQNKTRKTKRMCRSHLPIKASFVTCTSTLRKGYKVK
jgi:hypothetical protein